MKLRQIGGIAILLATSAAADSLAPRSSTTDPLVLAVQAFVDSHSLAGAVMLVADKDRILDVQAVGYSDIAANKRMTTGALFWIASQSKPIAATALMILVDDGKVHLDDPVEKYLPEFRHLWVKAEETGDHIILKRPSHPITIREILSHTSGLRPTSPVEQPTLDLLPMRVAALSYANTPLDFDPGTRWEYSNAGINTAGRIVEVVSGVPYQRFLADRIFEPLGMRDTTFCPSRRQIAMLAKSYRPDATKTGLEETTISQVKYPLNDPSRYPFPAGGLFSTAYDYCRFCQMILNGGNWKGKQIVSAASITEMTRKQTPPTMVEAYGLGWGVAGDSFGHGGAYATNFEIEPKRGLILIWMVQHAGFPNNGSRSFEAFKSAAIKTFSTKP